MVADAEQWRLLQLNLRQAKERGQIQHIEIYSLLKAMWGKLATQDGQIAYQGGEL